jgi:hypothetical protein
MHDASSSVAWNDDSIVEVKITSGADKIFIDFDVSVAAHF